MSITEIEAAISKLPPTEVDKLRSWLEDYHAQLWARQTDEEFEAGRFDTVIEEAFASGEPSPLTSDDLVEARRIVKDRIAARNLTK